MPRPLPLALRCAPLLSLLLLIGCAGRPHPARSPLPPATPAQTPQAAVDAAVGRVLARFPQVKPDEVALTLVDLCAPEAAPAASYRGDVPLYPASVVKLFYLWALHQALEEGRVTSGAELERAVRDMVVDSINDATAYVVDVVTGTTSGPELPATEMAAWAERRHAVNRMVASTPAFARHAASVNACQKTWNEGPYGREAAFVGARRENRNRLSTGATAQWWVEAVRGRLVTAERSAQMLALLRREWEAPLPPGVPADPDAEGRGFTAGGLPPGTRLYSKAGQTSSARHDAAYLELTDGRRLVLVVFTENHAEERALLPSLVREVLEGTGRLPPQSAATAQVCTGRPLAERSR